METWEITHADGSKGKINLEEAHRIASMVAVFCAVLYRGCKKLR